MARTPAARDGCCVDAQPLSTMLGSFVDRWNVERPPTGGQFSDGSSHRRDEFVRPLEYLSAGTGWPDREDGLSPTTIQNIYSGRRSTVELRHADALVAALDEPGAWYDGRLSVMPNPQARADAQAECCGGSLTGALPPAA